jgi:Pin2-interacting protein X1
MDPCVNQAWRNDTSSFGYKMLQKMGWSEGKGLGKKEDGRVENIKVLRRTDTRGVGQEVNLTGAAGWDAHSQGFNSLLSQLSKSADDGKAATKKEKKKKSKDGKKEKKPKATKDPDRPRPVRRLNRVVSRSRMLKQKDISQYSAADMAAILGVSAAPGSARAAETAPAAASAGSASADDDASRRAKAEKKLRKQAKAEKKRKAEAVADADVDSSPPAKTKKAKKRAKS